MADLTKVLGTRLLDVLSVQNACSILASVVDLHFPQLIDACLAYVFR